MYILDDLDRAILAHLAAVGTPQTIAAIHAAMQAHTLAATRHQVVQRVRGLHAARGLTCEERTSPHVRGITYAYTLRYPPHPKEPHAQRQTPDQDARACVANPDPLPPRVACDREGHRVSDRGGSQDDRQRPALSRGAGEGGDGWREGRRTQLRETLEDQVSEQPQPTTSVQSVPVAPLLRDALGRFSGVPPWITEAIEARTLAGVERYGVALHTHNGRDAIQDLREELLDAMQYLAQAHTEGRISAPFYIPTLAALVEILAIIGGPSDAP